MRTIVFLGERSLDEVLRDVAPAQPLLPPKEGRRGYIVVSLPMQAVVALKNCGYEVREDLVIGQID